MNDRADKDSSYHDRVAGEYDAIVVRPRDYPNDVLFAPIARAVPRGERMLDLGCGTGHMLLRFRSRFREAVGVDHSAGMIDRARANLAAANLPPAEFVRSDVLAWLASAPGSGFDLVTCVGVLHHLGPEQLPQALSGIARLLRPGGTVVLAEPVAVDVATMPEELQRWNARSLGARLAYSIAAEEPDEAPLDEALLRSDLGDAGFRIVAENRMWEMSTRSHAPSLIERYRMRRLIRRYGHSGNVLAMAVRKA